MKYIMQLLIIVGITYASEVMVQLLHIPFPGSVLGMLVLFGLLKSGVMKLDQIEATGNFLLDVLPIMFVPLGAGIMQYVDLIRADALPLLLILTLTTVLVMAVTGWVVQALAGKGADHVV